MLRRSDLLNPLCVALCEVDVVKLLKRFDLGRAPGVIFSAPDGFGNDFSQLLAKATSAGQTRYHWTVVSSWTTAAKVWELTIRDPRAASLLGLRRNWVAADIECIVKLLGRYRRAGAQTQPYARRVRDGLLAECRV